jgi:hypothetical protein
VTSNPRKAFSVLREISDSASCLGPEPAAIHGRRLSGMQIVWSGGSDLSTQQQQHATLTLALAFHCANNFSNRMANPEVVTTLHAP